MKFSEAQIKFALINHLAKYNIGKDFVIASEMNYAYKTKRADLVWLSDYCCAFEIKSDYDNDERLIYQINDYIKTFDCVYLVLTKNNYKEFKVPSDRVGLILFDGKVFNIKKQAKINKRLSKIHLASSCNKETLIHLIKDEKLSGKKYHDLVKMVVDNKKISELRSAFHTEIKKKFSGIYSEFLKNGRLSRFDYTE